MALLQTGRENADYLIGSPRLPARFAAQSLTDVTEYLFGPLRYALDGLRQWSMRRALRRWRIASERARQRRALAQLSDRDLRDIGITRYEIDFVLRQGLWRSR
jgi:uncharacterized protein YjiS (DUF1127 family)